MDQTKLKHTWTVDEKSWKIRFYLWAYKGDLATLTFCKLFWACTVAAPFAILLRLVSISIPKSKPKDKKDVAEKVQTKSERGADWAMRFSGWIGRAVDYLVAKTQPLGAFLNRHPLVGLITRILVLSGGVVIGLGGLGIGFYFWQDYSITSLEFVGGILGGVIAIAGISIGLAILADHYSKKFRVFGDWLYRTLTPLGHFFMGIGQFLAMGYYAVKTRTCPRIEVATNGSDVSA